MTENGKELEELRRAHAVLESRVATILPTLATKADLEAMGSHIISQISPKLERIWYWIATSPILIIASVLGLLVAIITTRTPSPGAAVSPPAAVTYHFYRQMPAPPPVAPPSQP